MTTFTTGGSAVQFTTSGSAVSFAVTPASNAFTTSAVLTPGAHASTHGAGGADPITTLGTVTTTLGTVTTLVANTATINAGTAAGLVHTGQSIFAAGSAAGPSLTFSGDTNTGIYSPGADQVGISTAGTARVHVSSTGNVGIGNLGAAYPLDVTGPIRSSNSATAGLIIGRRDTGAADTWILYSASGNYQLYSGAAGAEVYRFDTNGLITGTGTSLGAWTAYTPTIGGTGWALGNGTVTGDYCQIGKTVHFRCVITWGTSSTFGTAALQVGVPFAAVAASLLKFVANLRDASTGIEYNSLTAGASTSACVPQTIEAGGSAQSVTSTIPFTWADADVVRIYGTYERS